MHDEVYEATAATASSASSAQDARDSALSAASSPSEAYANMTLDTPEPSGAVAAADPENGTAAAAANTNSSHSHNDNNNNGLRSAAHPDAPPPRPPPRSSSPAKRPHSDMEGHANTAEAAAGNTRRNSGHSSPLATKSSHTAAVAPSSSSQHNLRAGSVDMVDAPNSDSSSTSNATSAATSFSAQPSPQHCADLPSLDDQVAQVLLLHSKQPSDGQEGYVISEKWLERVFARTTENIKKPEQFDKSAVEGEIGPVDNSDLVDLIAAKEELSDQREEDFVPLRPGLQLGQDFEILPSEAWELIISWYGSKEASPTIRRYAHNTSPNVYQSNIQYEIYPPVFTIRKVRRSAPEPSKPSPKLVASRSDGYMSFLKAAKQAAGIDIKTKVRVWRVLHSAPTDQPLPQSSGMLTPESSPRNGSPVAGPQNQPLPLVMDLASFNNLASGTERELVTGKDETNNAKYNGHMDLQLAGLAEDQVLILEEQDEKEEWLSESSTKTAPKDASQTSIVKASSKTNKGLQSATNSGRNSPAPSGVMTRGRTRNDRVRGRVGLTNLGNTCYMNSALQCIRSVEELSWYFLENEYKKDLNVDNPLGHNGSIAKSYAGLLASFYGDSTSSSFAPRAFKQALGKAQPLFSGYGQQDSQEFLSFLVDGLHEDLNRIKKKPYTEYPESDDNTISDPEAIKALGDKFREIHHSRNDSVAMDLFNGFYKNTMVCPSCDKVSITFDPYSLVTLQLPIEQTWQHDVTFVPLHGSPVKLEIDINKNASIKALKEYVAKRFAGVEWNRLMAAEVYSHKFYRVLDNNKAISECNIGQRDDIYFYELDDVPTNWPPPKKAGKAKSMLYMQVSSDDDIPTSSSPLADKMLVPIFHRGQSMSSYRSNQGSLILTPSYILLTREEAKDFDSILRKVLCKVAQMTTRPILSGLSNEESRPGSDVVITTEEDAAPVGDPRVQDGSVEGEDNMVEVTMTETPQTPTSNSSEKDEIADFFRPGSYIPDVFRNLFTMKHTKRDREMVPTGWSSVDAQKPYEPLTKRIPVTSSRQSSVQSIDDASNGSSSEEGVDDPQFSADAQSSIEMANQSSEDELQPSIETESSSFARGGRQKNKNSKKNKRKNPKFNKKIGQKMHQKKGKIPEQPSNAYSDPETDEVEGLVRLGEAIVLDWDPQAQDALFGANNENEERGMNVFNALDIFDDPELREKKAKRAARKKSGINLDECFQETSKSEILSEDNAWYCNRCKELRRATKTLEIWTVPDILVVHLKRFSSHRTFRDKIEALVDFPIEGLDLSGKVGLPEGKSLVYDLFAVDNHYGGLGGGHYTAYAQNFFDKNWYEYNDSSVSLVKDPSRVVSQYAYLLFYRRRSDGPLGPPAIQKLVEKVYAPNSDDADEAGGNDSEAPASRNLSQSPAGNGSRLGDSSRNGSSSAFAAGAGAGVLRGGGYLSAANLQLNGAAVETTDAEEMLLDNEGPPPYDEGYADEEDASYMAPVYEHVSYGADNGYDNTPGWDFSALRGQQGDDDAASSNEPILGDDYNGDRMLEDFGDDFGEDNAHPSTPFEEEIPALLGGEHGDHEVANISLDDMPVGAAHVKVE